MNIPSYCSSTLFLQIKKWFNIKNHIFINTLVTCENAKTSTNGMGLYY